MSSAKESTGPGVVLWSSQTWQPIFGAPGRLGFFLAAPIILAAGLYKIPTDLLGSNGAGVRGRP